MPRRSASRVPATATIRDSVFHSATAVYESRSRAARGTSPALCSGMAKKQPRKRPTAQQDDRSRDASTSHHGRTSSRPSEASTSENDEFVTDAEVEMREMGIPWDEEK